VATKIICDHCGNEILAESNQVTVRRRVKDNDRVLTRYLTKELHEHCFNVVFSTDIHSIKE
jgi:hypothetical protein